MMGADGSRDYFMGFQTNAEARRTGGLLGGFGVLHFDNGKFTVDELGANAELDKPFTPIDLGGEYNEQYGFTNPTTDFHNSNLSSHFPYAAQIWKSMWTQQTGVDVDGVVAIDPVALSYILGAVGPVTLTDEGEDQQFQSGGTGGIHCLSTFPDDQPARKRYLQGCRERRGEEDGRAVQSRGNCSTRWARLSVSAVSSTIRGCRRRMRMRDR